jgi:hypothetical protein
MLIKLNDLRETYIDPAAVLCITCTQFIEEVIYPFSQWADIIITGGHKIELSYDIGDSFGDIAVNKSNQEIKLNDIKKLVELNKKIELKND